MLRTLCIFSALLVATVLPVLAQTSAALIASDPGSQYRTLKSLVMEVMRMPTGDQFSPEHNLALCDLEIPPSEDAFANNLSIVAQQIVWAEVYLRWIKYPEAGWRGAMDELERNEIARLKDPSVYPFSGERGMDDLIAKLNEMRRVNPSLPEVTFGACGGPFGVALKIKTVPAGGELWVIPSFFYSLCQKQQLNPDDRDKCNHGREYSDGSEARVLGTYRYIATWPGGISRRGILDADDSSLPVVPCTREQKNEEDRCALVTISARQ